MKTFYVLFLSVLFIACQNPKPKPEAAPEPEPNAVEDVQMADDMDWLLGKWARLYEDEGKTTLEFWEKENASSYKGIGFTLQNADTIKLEYMHLTKAENLWDLTVEVLNEKPETFTGTNFSDQTFTVENNEIEFPNTIKYWMVGDTLKANVSSADFEIQFDFVKMAN